MKRAVIIFGLMAATGLSVDWPMHGLDAPRTRQTAEPIAPPLSTAWTAALGEEIVASPITAEGMVVVGTVDRTLRVLREDTGATVWSQTMPYDLVGTPAADTGRIFVPVADGTLHCLDLASGATVWTAPIGRNTFGSPVVVGGVLYLGLGAEERRFVAFDAATGLELWTVATIGIPYGTASVSGGTVYAGTSSGRVYAMDAATGAVNWTYATSGQFILSSPLTLGARVWAFPGNRDKVFYGLNAGTGALETSATVSDPAAPPIAEVTLSNIVTSSPGLSGTRLVATIRFDYWRDTDGDFFNDLYTMNEYAVGVNPASGGIAWQASIGSMTTANELSIPQVGSLSTPCSMSGGLYTAVASSLDPALRILNPLTGATLDSVVTGTSRSSPAATNARVVHATDAGTVFALEGSGNAPPGLAAAPLDPADGGETLDETPTISWGAAPDATDGPGTLRYLFRLDDDGEVLRDWDVEVQTGFGVQEVTIAGPLAWYTLYTWGVRAEDDEGARGPWAVRTFWVHQPPAPVTGLGAIPGNTLVQLQWTASAGPDVAFYNLYVNGAGPVNIGNVTTHTVTGLNNGQAYTFGIQAVDIDGDPSAIVNVVGTPTAAVPFVTLNGTPMVSLGAALGAAVPGDMISLGVGTHVVPNGATLNGVGIFGTNPRDTLLIGSAPGPVFNVVGGTVQIEMLTITGGDEGVLVTSGDLYLQNVVVRDHPGAGVRVANAGSVATVNLTTLLNNGAAGLSALMGTVALSNSILGGNGVGLQMIPGQSHTFNDYFGNGVDVQGDVIGPTEHTFGVTFEDPPANDYREVMGSPTIDLGRPGDAYDNEPTPNGSRVNMGAFGNTSLATRSGSGSTAGGGGGGGGGCGLSGTGNNGKSAWVLALLGAFILARRRS